MTIDKRRSFWQVISGLGVPLGRFRFGGKGISGMALFSAVDTPLFEEDSFLDEEGETFHCPKLYPKLFRRWRGAQTRRVPKPISSAIRY